MRGLFFLLGILGIVLALNINLKAKPVEFPNVSIFAYSEVEGLTATLCVIPEKKTPDVVNCTCNGTGKVKSGDGLVEIPCDCGVNCTCAKKDNGSLPEVKVEAVEINLQSPTAENNKFKLLKKNFLVYIGAEWCGRCVYMKNTIFPQLKNNEWDFDGVKRKYTIGEDINNMIIVVDYDSKDMDDLCEFLDITKPMGIPTIWKINIRSKTKVAEILGTTTAEKIHYFYNNK